MQVRKSAECRERQVMEMLDGVELSTLEVAARLELTQNGASHILNCARKKGLLERRLAPTSIKGREAIWKIKSQTVNGYEAQASGQIEKFKHARWA